MIKTRTLAIEQGSCAAHKYHRPEPTFWEEHHIVPQAWQYFYVPGDDPGRPLGLVQGRAAHRDAIDQLWDKRKAVLCRTGHGNVHWWLVRFMKAIERWPRDTPEVQVIDQVIYNVSTGIRRWPKEREIARLAMVRFSDAGGSLRELADAHQYGQI